MDRRAEQNVMHAMLRVVSDFKFIVLKRQQIGHKYAVSAAFSCFYSSRPFQGGLNLKQKEFRSEAGESF
ncbi:hypothetical protein Nepgr_022646 [Nepenthes gracilis]|uniref:Uncharacterized protein n=1 Tax=Nepenthes gracilis TaxID=150966 RepID=A0AAD3XYA4_NEPGR|nr:hypothetical protein Nepgr_022646 [Nepenthes gracilis]